MIIHRLLLVASLFFVISESRDGRSKESPKANKRKNIHSKKSTKYAPQMILPLDLSKNDFESKYKSVINRLYGIKDGDGPSPRDIGFSCRLHSELIKKGKSITAGDCFRKELKDLLGLWVDLVKEIKPLDDNSEFIKALKCNDQITEIISQKAKV